MTKTILQCLHQHPNRVWFKAGDRVGIKDKNRVKARILGAETVGFDILHFFFFGNKLANHSHGAIWNLWIYTKSSLEDNNPVHPKHKTPIRIVIFVSKNSWPKDAEENIIDTWKFYKLYYESQLKICGKYALLICNWDWFWCLSNVFLYLLLLMM